MQGNTIRHKYVQDHRIYKKKCKIKKDAYCTDIIMQVAAVNAVLNSFNKVLLTEHIKTSVTRDIKEGREETVDDLVNTIQKLMK